MVKDYLRDQQVLLLLDNLGHLPDATPFITDRLDEARHVKVLATSRAPRHLSSEHELAVAPLALPATDDRDDPASAASERRVRPQGARPDSLALNAAPVRDLRSSMVAAALERYRLRARRKIHDRFDRRPPLLTRSAGSLISARCATLDWL
jgi:hypothetical protein